MGSYDNYLYAINPDGSQKWRLKTGGSVRSSPAVGSEGTVYVGSYDSYLYAVNTDGSLRWKFKTGKSIYSSPAIGADGTVYVGSGDTYLYAFAPEIPGASTITVTAPNGSEAWPAFSTQNITWTSQNLTNVKLEYSANNGSSWTEISASVSASAGTYSWTVPNTPSSQCLVRITDASNATITDRSNAVFTIAQPVIPTITVTSPNGGEN